MARPRKSGLDYFPLNCVLDTKVEMLQVAHGNDGFAVWVKLLQEIYQSESGVLDISDVLRCRTLAKRANVSAELWNNVVQTCVEVGLFESESYQNKILTSAGIRKRLAEVEKMRERSRERAQHSSAPQNSGRNTVKGKGKGKESSSTKESTPSTTSPEAPHEESPVALLVLNTGEKFPLFESQVDEFQPLYPATDVLQEFRKMQAWCSTNPKNRKTRDGVMSFVNRWLAKVQDSGNKNSGNSNADRSTRAGTPPAAGKPQSSYERRMSLTVDDVNASREEWLRSIGADPDASGGDSS